MHQNFEPPKYLRPVLGIVTWPATHYRECGLAPFPLVVSHVFWKITWLLWRNGPYFGCCQFALFSLYKTTLPLQILLFQKTVVHGRAADATKHLGGEPGPIAMESSVLQYEERSSPSCWMAKEATGTEMSITSSSLFNLARGITIQGPCGSPSASVEHFVNLHQTCNKPAATLS